MHPSPPSRISLVAVQPAAEGLHAALDQPCRGGGGSAEVPGDVGQRPALEVAQPDGLTLVIGERRQGPG